MLPSPLDDMRIVANMSGKTKIAATKPNPVFQKPFRIVVEPEGDSWHGYRTEYILVDKRNSEVCKLSYHHDYNNKNTRKQLKDFLRNLRDFLNNQP